MHLLHKLILSESFEFDLILRWVQGSIMGPAKLPLSKTYIILFNNSSIACCFCKLLIHGVEDCLGLVAREESVKCENYLDFPRERLQSRVEQRQREGERGFCLKPAPRKQ